MNSPPVGTPARAEIAKNLLTKQSHQRRRNPKKVDYIIALQENPSTSKAALQSSVIARHTMHNGMLAIIFKGEDYYGVMADECKLTLVGKFTYGRP